MPKVSDATDCTKSQARSYGWFLGILIGVGIIAWVAWPALLVVGEAMASGKWPGFDLERLGQFGDMFGGLNALFTGLAFCAVWWTGRMQRDGLELQREELQAQRRELELQRGEMQAQREELAETRSVMARQKFESTFFQLLTVLRDLVDSAQIGQLHGYEAIGNISTAFAHSVNKIPGNSDHPRSRYAENYTNHVNNSMGHFLDTYFRTLYNIIRWIDDNSELTEHEKKSYSRIVRSQLDGRTLILLSGSGCVDAKSKKMQPFIEKFALLKHLDCTSVGQLVTACYPPSAFGLPEPAPRD